MTTNIRVVDLNARANIVLTKGLTQKEPTTHLILWEKADLQFRKRILEQVEAREHVPGQVEVREHVPRQVEVRKLVVRELQCEEDRGAVIRCLFEEMGIREQGKSARRGSGRREYGKRGLRRRG